MVGFGLLYPFLPNHFFTMSLLPFCRLAWTFVDGALVHVVHVMLLTVMFSMVPILIMMCCFCGSGL